MLELMYSIGLSTVYITFYLYFIKKYCLKHLKKNFGLFMVLLMYLFIIYSTLSVKFVFQMIFYTSFIGMLFNTEELKYLSNYDNKCEPIISIMDKVFTNINYVLHYPFKLYSSFIKFYKLQFLKATQNIMDDDKDLNNLTELTKSMKSMMESLNSELDRNELEFKQTKKELLNITKNTDIETETKLNDILENSINVNENKQEPQLDFESLMGGDIKNKDLEKMMEEQFKNIDINQMFGMIFQNMQNIMPPDKMNKRIDETILQDNETILQEDSEIIAINENEDLEDTKSVSEKSEDLDTFLVG